MATREGIKKDLDEGLTLGENLKKAKDLHTAGVLLKEKSCRDGRDILKIHEDNTATETNKRKTQLAKDQEAYRILQCEATALLALGIGIVKTSNI